MPNILASGISNYTHIAELDALVEARFKLIPVDKLLIYLIDTVDADALPFLADQFDVLGIKGWNQTSNEAEKRELIKNAIELHRYKGTPWAVRQAVRSIGFFDAEIIEHVGIDHDGTILRNGTQVRGGGNPFNFRVRLDLGDDVGISAEKMRLARLVIEEYKNVRSHLVDIGFIATMADENTFVDELDFEVTTGNETVVFENGAYNGSINYNEDSNFDYATDIVSLNITNLDEEKF